ncbi:MAG TPA: cystathionine beta-lyase [Prevotella sp.]|nr:cystathionine beta-lyase [Prevotella sp.]
MKNYDFSHPVDRRHSDSVKWNHFPEDDVIPLWVADMDFPAAPVIQEALRRRVEHGVFGYAQVDDDYYDAILSWQRRRHHWPVERPWILYTTGVVPATSCAIKALTLPGEKVLVMTPVYNCFFSSIRNQGCGVEECALLRRGDSYVVDWQDFEARCQDEKVTVFLLCNPHNPVGRVWTREELERMGDICARNHVRVISDEIHCELMMPGQTFVPFAAANELNERNSVTLCSPSKSFNIAGLQNAYLVCRDDEMRRRIDRVINIFEVCDVNPFGIEALKAAYNEGEQWLDDLCHYIYGNYLWLKTFLAERLPNTSVCRLEGTYLAWVDIRALGISSDEATRRLLHEGRVFVSSGTLYGQRDGEGYLRINLACPRQTLEEGMRRVAKVLYYI